MSLSFSAQARHLSTEEDVLDYLNSVHLIEPGFVVSSASPLQGGLINMVYRLHLSPVEGNNAPKTCILKYYPPFLKVDDSVSFSQDRYFVEKEALLTVQRFLPTLNTSVRVPKVNGFSDSDRVLILEDAGQHLLSLKDCFLAPPAAPQHPAISPSALAQRLATFLVSLYTLDTAQLPKAFDNSAAWEMINRHIVGQFEPNLRQAGALERLRHWVPLAKPLTPPPDAVLTMGDLWPNSVYIAPNEPDTIWLLDWEFARFGSALSDTWQLLAYLFIMERGAGAAFDGAAVAAFRRALLGAVAQGAGRAFGAAEHAGFMMLLASAVNDEGWRCDDAAGLLEAASREVAEYFTTA